MNTEQRPEFLNVTVRCVAIIEEEWAYRVTPEGWEAIEDEGVVLAPDTSFADLADLPGVELLPNSPTDRVIGGEDERVVRSVEDGSTGAELSNIDFGSDNL